MNAGISTVLILWGAKFFIRGFSEILNSLKLFSPDSQTDTGAYRENIISVACQNPSGKKIVAKMMKSNNGKLHNFHIWILAWVFLDENLSISEKE